MAGLRDKYAIVGIGQTEFSRDSGRTTRALAVEAVRMAMMDAGLQASEVDGMMSYSMNDSTASPVVAGDLGMRLNFYMDVSGGGSTIEALVGLAMGAIEAGMCQTVVIFRGLNG
jgi:acetyl-CoA acetyltransferase